MAYNIAFAGTPDFACPTLQALIDSEHYVSCVFTQPDRVRGRGQQVHASPVKTLALAHNIPVYQPPSLKDNVEIEQILLKHDPHIIIVVAYGHIIPPWLLAFTPLGCINVHASILPAWRGAAPIQHSILAGDTMSGVTIMVMEEGLDTGPMLKQKRVEITSTTTAGTLHDELATLGAKTLISTLEELPGYLLHQQFQRDHQASYASKIQKQDAMINWEQTAEELDRHIRAYYPWPTAFTFYQGQRIKIITATPISTSTLPNNDQTSSPGTIIDINDEAIVIQTGESCLSIQCIQFPGEKPITPKQLRQRSKALLDIHSTFESA